MNRMTKHSLNATLIAAALGVTGAAHAIRVETPDFNEATCHYTYLAEVQDTLTGEINATPLFTGTVVGIGDEPRNAVYDARENMRACFERYRAHLAMDRRDATSFDLSACDDVHTEALSAETWPSHASLVYDAIGVAHGECAGSDTSGNFEIRVRAFLTSDVGNCPSQDYRAALYVEDLCPRQ